MCESRGEFLQGKHTQQSICAAHFVVMPKHLNMKLVIDCLWLFHATPHFRVCSTNKCTKSKKSNARVFDRNHRPRYQGAGQITNVIFAYPHVADWSQ